MVLRVRDSHSRSILEAVSWRVTGSIDTFAHRWRYSKARQRWSYRRILVTEGVRWQRLELAI